MRQTEFLKFAVAGLLAVSLDGFAFENNETTQLEVPEALEALLMEPEATTAPTFSDENAESLPVESAPPPLSFGPWDDANVLAGDAVLAKNRRYVDAIGRMTYTTTGLEDGILTTRKSECVVTRVSPPNAEVTAFVTAAHCPPEGSVDFPASAIKPSLRKIVCPQNPKWTGPANDIKICFSDEKQNFASYGCLDKRVVGKDEELIVFGYGNPRGGPMLDRLYAGSFRTTGYASDGTLLALGAGVMAGPGDSGGTVVPVADVEKETTAHFSIVGVLSGGKPGTNFTVLGPVSDNAVTYIENEIKKVAGATRKVSVCGINYWPEVPEKVTPTPSPMPTP